MDIKDIQNLIKFVAKSGAQEVKLEMEDVKITIKTGADPVKIETGGVVQQLQAVPQREVHGLRAASANHSKVDWTPCGVDQGVQGWFSHHL